MFFETGLVVVDTIALPFRYAQPAPLAKAKLLRLIGAHLLALSRRYNIQVFFIYLLYFMLE